MSLVGTIKHSGQVERAVMQRLRDWSSHYLAEVEAQDGRPRGFAQRLRSVQSISELRRWPEDQLPAAFVVASGSTEPPEKLSTGYYQHRLAVGVMVVCSGAEEIDTRLLAQMYGAAVRASLVKNRTLGGVAETTEWVGESTDDLPIEESRTLQATIQLFEIVQGDVVSWKDAPTTPTEPPIDPLPPLPPWPAAEDVDADITKIPVTEAIERSADGRSP
jgi:hypothetical protein